MITLYLDPSDGNQVVGFYKDCQPGNPTVWTDRGLVEVVVAKNHSEYANLSRYQRDCQFNDDLVNPRTNPVQPVPDARTVARAAAKESGRVKLQALGLTNEEIAAMGIR